MSKKDSQFGQLIDELDTMSKALEAEDDDLDDDLDDQGGDEKIKAAADDGGIDEGEDPDVLDDDDDDDLLGKSLSVTLDNGDKIHAIDGTELVKSLISRMDDSDSDMKKALGLTIGNIQKVAERINDQAQVIVEQGKLIKSLSETVERIGGSSAGRKTILDVHEKKSGDELHKAESADGDGLTGQEFMSKALTLQKNGGITGLEISKAESCINAGVSIPESIIKKVVG